MLDIYLDVESTGICPYNDEIIHAYFEVYDKGVVVDSYLLKTKVRTWSYDAEKIHKISEKLANTYSEKKIAYREFLKWLPKNFRFITYTNKQTMLGTINFDVAILKNELDLLGYYPYMLENKWDMKNPISVHTLVKEMKRSKTIEVFGNNSQENVYFNLFKEKYNTHDAVDDVKALVRIHKRLLLLQHDNDTILRIS